MSSQKEEKITISEMFAKMTNSQLEREFAVYDDMVNRTQCYGTKDVLMLHAIEDEIERRGGRFETVTNIIFDDKDSDDED